MLAGLLGQQPGLGPGALDAQQRDESRLAALGVLAGLLADLLGAAFDVQQVVGDLEGVVVIPAHLANEVAEEGFEMTAFEDFVTEEVRNGTPTVGLYPPTKEESLTRFAAWRKANGR